MNLRDFRESKEPPITQVEMGKMIGVTDSCVSRYESGDTTPSPEKIVRIETITGGKVQLRDFVPHASSDN